MRYLSYVSLIILCCHHFNVKFNPKDTPFQMQNVNFIFTTNWNIKKKKYRYTFHVKLANKTSHALKTRNQNRLWGLIRSKTQNEI